MPNASASLRCRASSAHPKASYLVSETLPPTSQEWRERATEVNETAAGWLMRPRGAYVMGRNMFGPIRGEWEEDWRGWWGPEPPYHAPVFVLTHHAREPIEMEGGTTFHFVTDGFDAAYAQARETAGDDGVNEGENLTLAGDWVMYADILRGRVSL